MQPFQWYFEAGGILMWPLLACAVIALGVIMERLVRLRRSLIIDSSAVVNIQKLIGEGHTQTAIDKYRGATTLITRAIARGLDDHIRQGAGIENALRSHGDRELVVLTNNLGILSMLAKITPLLGLLGTILGMIDAFTILEKSGVNRSGLTGAVRQALVASAAGLLIAIPCVIALSFFRGLIRRHVAEAEAILDGVARSVSTGVEKKAEKTTETVKEEQFELPSILSGKPAG